MATLQSIRNKGPLLAVIIGFALMAFILGDFINQGSSLFSGNQFEIAEINGESISLQDYQQRVDEAIAVYKLQSGRTAVDENVRDQFRKEVWDLMVQEYVLGEEYEELGVGVSSDEIFDMVQGQNIDPIVQALFTNQETGAFDPNIVVQFLKQMEQDETGQSKAIWLYYEQQIIINRKFAKYNNLITKGLNVNMAQTKQEFAERNYIVDFNYIEKPYAGMLDQELEITDSEISDYYKAHKSFFEQDASRDLVYVTFDVVPSQSDFDKDQKWINSIHKEFISVTDNKQFINYNSDTRFDEMYYATGDFNNAVLDTFLQSAAMSDVFGPYEENGTLKMAKLIDRKNMPDSIRVRHILIQPNGTTIIDVASAVVVADSIKQVLTGGTSFSELAIAHSSDQQSALKGGELEWVTEYTNFVQELKEACFDGAINQVQVIETKYGVHIIEVLEKTKAYDQVQVGIVERKIEPSQATYQQYYTMANKFAGEIKSLEDFDAQTKELALLRKEANNITTNVKTIAGLQSPRELIQWMFKPETEKGQVSDVFEFGDRYVVGILSAVREKGIAPQEQVIENLRTLVAKEKKAKLFAKELNENKAANLAETASKMKLEVKNAKNISFTSYIIPNLGFEPKLIGTCVSLEKGAVSEPIEGETGVFLIEVSSITSNSAMDENIIANEQKQLNFRLQASLGRNGFIYGAMTEIANIVDSRSKFY